VQRGLSKAVKKTVVKNHLLGMDPQENAKSSGVKLTPEEVGNIIDEFGAEADRSGLDAAAKDYGVSNITKELAEVARFKKENKFEFAELIEGARIASTLKKFGAGMPEFEQFLGGVYSRSLEKGYTPNEIIAQSGKLGSLEKKYGLTYEKLRDAYEETGKTLASKKKEISDLETDVVQIIKKKSDLLARFSLDEQKIQEYAAAKQELTGFGLDMSNLQGIKNFLVALKSANFDAKEVIARLNSLSDLQAQKGKIQQEVSTANRELDEKKRAIGDLQKTVEKYTKQKGEIDAYSELRSSGVDAKRMQDWNQIIKASNLDFAAIEGELRSQANLKGLEEKISGKIKELLAEELKLNQSIAHLGQEKQNLEVSAKAIKEGTLNEISAMSAKIVSSLSTLNDAAQAKLEQTSKRSIEALEEISSSSDQKIKQVTDNALNEVKTIAAEAKTSADEFSRELKSAIEQAAPEIKNVGSALEAGEKIGKYRNILPLLELIDGGGKADESEALIAMWNLTSRFNAWLENHYPKAKKSMSQPLGELLESINGEIQRVGGE
jgi:hypothetical protein